MHFLAEFRGSQTQLPLGKELAKIVVRKPIVEVDVLESVDWRWGMNIG